MKTRTMVMMVPIEVLLTLLCRRLFFFLGDCNITSLASHGLCVYRTECRRWTPLLAQYFKLPQSVSRHVSDVSISHCAKIKSVFGCLGPGRLVLTQWLMVCVTSKKSKHKTVGVRQNTIMKQSLAEQPVYSKISIAC